MEDLSHMTGQNNFNAPRGMTLDEVKLVGNSMQGKGGHFKFVHLTKEKGEDGKYPLTLTKECAPLSCVFLIVRRRLVESTQEGLKRWTSEHDTPNDVVQLFGEGRDKAPATELRNRHERLRTEQVVYIRHKGEILRLRIKGLSLRPTNEKDSHTAFYQYMQSFKDGEQLFAYSTKLTPVEVDSDNGKNWAINFERGEKLSDEQLALVVENIKKVYAHNQKIDAYYNKVAAVDQAADAQLDALGGNAIEYPEEDINPEDIPF